MELIVINSRKLEINFYTLIIKAESILRFYKNLKEFQSLANVAMLTNNELILLHDMVIPSDNDQMLSRDTFSLIIDDFLVPKGLRRNIDYTLAEEQMIFGVRGSVNPLLGKELPEIENLDWVDSQVTEDGCFVWLSDSNIID